MAMHLVTGAFVRAVPAKGDQPSKTYAKVCLVKSKTAQPGIAGLEAVTVDCADIKGINEVVANLGTFGPHVCEVELDSVTFGKDTRVSVSGIASRVDTAFTFGKDGMNFSKRAAPTAGNGTGAPAAPALAAR